MGRKKYPPLTPSEVISILGKLGFVRKAGSGDHETYERVASDGRPRSVVTVDTGASELDDYLIKSMIRQSNFSREEFCGATKRTARKASLPHLRYQ
jgi:predicted RNA binding protein YcfA (HicA-like mRNA interferase family)